MGTGVSGVLLVLLFEMVFVWLSGSLGCVMLPVLVMV